MECEAKSLQRVSFCLVQHLISLLWRRTSLSFPPLTAPIGIFMEEEVEEVLLVEVEGCASLDWLLKQPRSHFVQKESRTCQGCWQSVLGISGPAARQSLIPHCIVIYLPAVLKGISIWNSTHRDAGSVQNHKSSFGSLSTFTACLFSRLTAEDGRGHVHVTAAGRHDEMSDNKTTFIIYVVLKGVLLVRLTL